MKTAIRVVGPTTGVDFLRIIPGLRDMPPGIGAESMQGLAKVRAALQAEASA